jgi:hypothetical protein
VGRDLEHHYLIDGQRESANSRWFYHAATDWDACFACERCREWGTCSTYLTGEFCCKCGTGP